MQPFEARDARAARQAADLGHFGNDADGRVVALVARDEQDARLAADVERQRHAHIREDDRVVQGYQQHLVHVVHTPRFGLSTIVATDNEATADSVRRGEHRP